MPNTIVNTIYGQRFSIDEAATIEPNSQSVERWLLPEFHMQSDADLNRFSAGLRTLLSSGRVPSEIFPVLDLDLEWLKLGFEQKINDITATLSANNICNVVIGVDEDNPAIRALSPRFSDDASRERIRSEISEVIEFFKLRLGSCLVALTVEELCPGGLDATDGIALVRHFVAAGATGIIASGGSIDFAPLKYRRQTQQKKEEGREFKEWPEAWLASAQWLVGRVDVPIYAQGQIQNFEKCWQTAIQLGLCGIISASVKHPSASLSMARS